MKCPQCDSLQDKVIESRMLATGESIRRRRECLRCGYRFTSYEQIDEKKLMVVKSSGRREPFDVKKLERGIQRALEKRPVAQVQIEEILLQLENEARIMGQNTNEVHSSTLGELVLKILYNLDRVAYIRFASVYRKFENVDEFVQEIEKVSNTR